MGIMLSAARHTAKLKRNNTEYKIREFLHLHAGKDCAVILIDIQIEH